MIHCMINIKKLITKIVFLPGRPGECDRSPKNGDLESMPGSPFWPAIEIPGAPGGPGGPGCPRGPATGMYSPLLPADGRPGGPGSPFRPSVPRSPLSPFTSCCKMCTT